MADSKISELTALTTPASDDVLAIVDTSAGVTKKITISNLATSSEVVDDTSPQLGGDLASNGSDILFADNDKAMFGTGNDLQIYHDGSDSYIKDAGTGFMVISATDLLLQNAANSANYMKAFNGAAVELYHNNNKKFETTSTGIDVTGAVNSGSLTVDTMTLDGSTLSSTGGLVIDLASNLTIDVDGTTITLADGGVNFGQFYNNSSGTFNIVSPTQDKDIVFRGNDGGSGIVALTLDISNAGAATFNSTVTAVSVVSPFISLGNTSNTYQTVTGTDNGNDVNYRTYANHIWKNTTGASSSTDGTERMRLTSTGLGIGTASPTRNLTIHGGSSNSILALQNNTTGATSGDGFQLQLVGNDLYQFNYDNGFMVFATNSSERMRILSSGNVGIGETSPLSKLHVKTADSGMGSINANADELVIEGSGASGLTILSGASSKSNIFFGDSGSNAIGDIGYDHSSNALNIGVNGSEAMRIDSSGKVGIGTTSPNSMFEVRDNASPTIRVTDGDANNITHMQADGANGGYFGTLTSHDVRIAPNNSTKLIVKVDGKVGIGVTNPAVTMELAGNGGAIRLPTGGELQFGNANNFILGNSGSNYLAFTTNSSERLRIDSDGKIGIGTSSPSNLIDIVTSVNAPLMEIRSTVTPDGSKFGGGIVLGLSQANDSGSGQPDTQAGDTLGRIVFEGQGTDYTYNGAEISTVVTVGDGNDGRDNQATALVFKTIAVGGNSSAETVRFSATENVFNEASADLDFRVESNGNANMLFVDGGTDNVMIGTSTNIDRWFNSAPGKSTIFQTSGIDDANRVNAFTHHANNSGGAMVMLGKSRGGAVGYTAVAESDEIGQISFQGADGTDMVEAAKIIVAVDTAPGANDMPGRMAFHTTANGAASSTERMRIDNSGRMQLNMSTFGSSVSASVTGFEIHKNGSSPFIQHGTTGTGATTRYNFFNGNGVVGSISTSGSATTYATSSDYRLKENVVTDWDATTRLKQLKPSRFNFIADADTTVDGFLAHEVSSIVPEAIFGDKDKTETKTNVVVHANGHVIADGITEANWTAGKVADEDGNTIYPTDSTWAASKVVPVYQAIDQSKLVPLLVKTIQELEARITTLENN